MLQEFSNKFTTLTPEFWLQMCHDIKDFRNTFQLPVNNPISVNDCKVHNSLHIEELVELALATNKAEQADAILDAVYTLVGRTAQVGKYDMESSSVAHMVDILLATALTLEIPYEACWRAIHASNMTKAASTEEEALTTVEHYKNRGIAGEVFVADSGKYLIKCSEDSTDETGSMIRKGKVLKSVKYTPVDLVKVLQEA
ncbi:MULTISPECIES: nucleoside triphosphate pyrophosphohydrolase family protein [Vibrio]|uniref:nucleoside triphosphate pyrophosphohydrolase family protein n=1 Tax=Vibrio TaxID=662 RepID=UPI000066F6C2|nr:MULTISPECIES: nucleoside triphosphate pyrophosphohydrolase family protein [Vibrio]EAP94663.1 hypothetical protein V12B01_04888 [Vibrio splendidus 12B01]PMI69709.1 hypothetical protein BCU43_24460 [Vibrio lentus]